MTRPFEVEYRRPAQRYLARLEMRDRERIENAIERLALDRRDPLLDVRKLEHRPEKRLRVGSHRVLFETDDDACVIVVKVIRRRGDAYKR